MIRASFPFKVRENKILELNHNCVGLREEADKLKSRLDHEDKERNLNSEAIRRMTEDFSQRLSSVEKRYHQAVAEKETLLKQLEAAKVGQDLADQVEEKEEILRELRQEGEKLSKQQLTQSNIIKKLRAKEKEDEQQVKLLKYAISFLQLTFSFPEFY